MLKKIFGTFSTRVLNALCGFITLWIGTRYLGSTAWGIGGTVLVDVTLLLIGVELMAGSGLIYFTPRKSFRTIMKTSFLWIFIVISVYSILFYILSFTPALNVFVPEGYEVILLILVFVYSFHNFNLNILIGKERVNTQNIIFIIQFMTQMLSMIGYIFILDIRDARAFVYSLLTGYITGCICGFFTIIKYINDDRHESLKACMKEMLHFGTIIQLSSLLSLLNKRLSFYFIKSFSNISDVGIYNSGTQVSECTKLIGHSIALVQFSKISNLKDEKKAAQLTILFLKIAVAATLFFNIILCIIPTEVYSWIFTDAFSGIRIVIITTSLGMAFMAANMVFSHYFSGINKPKHNLMASAVGLVVTIPSVSTLVPLYGIAGAGISFTLTSLATIIYQWIVFKKLSSAKSRELLPTAEDISLIKKEIMSFMTKNGLRKEKNEVQ